MQDFVMQLQLIQCWRSVCFTNLSNYVFVYIAGEVIPTIPPECAIYLVKILKKTD